MKKFIFLLFTCLLLVALVLPACKPAEKAETIKIGVIGPMEYVQGEHHWWGAEMGRDEVNAAGGIKVGDKTYMVELIKADSNEILSTTDAASAMEKLITVDGADFVVGGFRTEAVFPMQEVAMDYETIFLDCGAATLELCTVVGTDYDRYKYFFRVTPICNNHLVANTLMSVGMAGAIIKEETGIQRPLKVAICAEGAQWADSMVNIMNALIPSRLGMEVVGTWRPSPTASEVNAEMTAMEAAGADIIVPIISGPLGIPYARSWGELEVPAASVGINVESQKLSFLEATSGFGAYETTLNTYAEGVEMSEFTKPFVDAFIEANGQLPTYTAGTHDAILLLLKPAIEKAGTLDADAVVAELEKIDSVGTTGRFMFTNMETAPYKNPHDVRWGPEYVTGITSQWQDGKIRCVWPKAEYGTDDWAGVEYPGTYKWQAPPRVIEKLKAEAATEPEAPAEPAEPAAPAEGAATSFKAKTYANDEYGFSIQYPDNWVDRPELVTTPMHVAAFGVPAFIPGVVICRFDTTEPITADWITQSFQELGNQNFKVLSDLGETTLPDGTAATVYEASYVSATGYEILSYQIDADEGDNRIRLILFTIDAFDPYADNKALFEEVAQTLTFK